MTGNFYSSAVSPGCCLCLLDSDLNWGHPMPFPSPGPADPEQDMLTEEDVIKHLGIHQTEMMRQYVQSTQDSVHSAETNNLWVETRKSSANWDLLGGLERN